jgi:serine/threonine protein kinase
MYDGLFLDVALICVPQGNVLIDSSGSPRLTDFGLATIVGDEDLQLSKSTAYRNLDSRWRAPEVLGMNDKANPERPTFESDIYSFGGVMFYVGSLFFGSSPLSLSLSDYLWGQAMEREGSISNLLRAGDSN